MSQLQKQFQDLRITRSRCRDIVDYADMPFLDSDVDEDYHKYMDRLEQSAVEAAIF